MDTNPSCTSFIGTTKDRIVSTDQQHTATVIRVTGEDAGKGVTIRPGFDSVDGLVTCEKDLALVVYGSDCVPVMFADPVREAIGVCHAGWKGTAGRIAKNTVEMMAGEFGTDPKDLICGIGPSVCADCYEVSEDVAQIFMKEFSGREEEVIKDRYAQGTEMKYMEDGAIMYRSVIGNLTGANDGGWHWAHALEELTSYKSVDSSLVGEAVDELKQEWARKYEDLLDTKNSTRRQEKIKAWEQRVEKAFADYVTQGFLTESDVASFIREVKYNTYDPYADEEEEDDEDSFFYDD